MTTVTVSPKFQVVIPKKLREALHLKPGQRLTAMTWGNGVKFIPELSLEQVQDMFVGVNGELVRDKTDRVIT